MQSTKTFCSYDTGFVTMFVGIKRGSFRCIIGCDELISWSKIEDMVATVSASPPFDAVAREAADLAFGSPSDVRQLRTESGTSTPFLRFDLLRNERMKNRIGLA